ATWSMNSRMERELPAGKVFDFVYPVLLGQDAEEFPMPALVIVHLARLEFAQELRRTEPILVFALC
ncbi:MAG TPA: hypothetical protein VIR57_16285, partial [Chloroflexota bacterium]